MRSWYALMLLATWVVVSACERSGDPPASPVTQSATAAGPTLDPSERAGRLFMYLDDGGNVVKTSRYQDIPLDKRAAVMVIEGRKRSRVRARKQGGISIEALPPKVTASPEETAGAADAKTLLTQHPPASAGPPSTESWSDAQWREELKRELLELKKEQAAEPE